LSLIYISVGFYDVANQHDWRNQETFHFGIIIYISFFLGLREQPYDLKGWSAYGYTSYPRILESIQVDNLYFPVFLKTMRELPHCTDPQPISGTKACAAESSVPGQKVGMGFLTARHVTGPIIQSRVQLDCGHVGFVADVGKEGIDAAFVICAKCKMKK
jgi:hypothetical protein